MGFLKLEHMDLNPSLYLLFFCSIGKRLMYFTSVQSVLRSSGPPINGQKRSYNSPFKGLNANNIKV